MKYKKLIGDFILPAFWLICLFNLRNTKENKIEHEPVQVDPNTVSAGPGLLDYINGQVPDKKVENNI